MSEITRVGVDLAKRQVQVHAVDGGERIVLARSMSRERFAQWLRELPAGCIVAMEAASRFLPLQTRHAQMHRQVRPAAGELG